MAILHPIPTPAELPQAGDWWSEQRKFVKRRSGLKKIRKPLQNFLCGEQKQRLIRQTRKVVPAGKLLDIGCGTGKLLKIARQWYDCEGVEPSERAANECRQNGFRVGFHTYLFTGHTLTGALNRAGFDVLNRPKRDRPLDDLLLLWGRKRPETGVELLGRAA